MTENFSKPAGKPKNPLKNIPFEQFQEILAATQSNAHNGSILINLLERFRENLTSMEQAVMIETIQIYYPWYGRQKEIIRNPRNNDNNSGHQAGVVPAEEHQIPPEEPPEPEENALDLSDEELAEIYPQYSSTEPAKVSKASTEE